MATEIMKKSRTAAYNKSLKGKKWVYSLDKAIKKNWKNYKAKLDNMLKGKLSKKVALGRTKAKKKKSISDDIKKDLKIIEKICQQCAIEIGQEISNSIRININLQITNLNNIYKTEIEELSEKVWSKRRLENLKTCAAKQFKKS
ncbi:11850_t:CDS:2 [Cetraspora pellucida]|uniref:11850_t:CDS:1 n=1 Tax=Cetraspora pellucida TaxID=1433469 RepID=A0ACA9MHP3_9GLOM|nr:11850_t:CDS:2 [Cetraspora pellucida]